jgi:hypothetical protein
MRYEQKDKGVAMFERILEVMRDKIRKRQHIMTIHAEEEMDYDRSTV